MGDTSHDDPFTWDVDRVIQELCTANRTWKPTARASFPEPVQLAAKLRECEYDGEVLLVALDNQADLWADLNVHQTKLKMTIRTAIQQFRNKSALYRAYKKSMSDDSDEHMIGSDKRPDSPESPANGYLLHSPSQAQAVQRPKKRRLFTTDLVNVSQPQRDARFSAATILTEADAIMPLHMAKTRSIPRNAAFQASKTPDLERFHESLFSEPGAYWGNGHLSRKDVWDRDASVNASINDSVDDEAEFGWGRPKPFGRARKRLVSGQIKRYLGHRSVTADSDDSILPMFGDSDDEENAAEWEAIDREIAEEDEDILREQQLEANSGRLSPAQVEEILHQQVENFTARWQEVKLPSQQRGAFSMWTRAHQRSGEWKRQIYQLTGEMQKLNGRLTQLIDTFKDTTYSSAAELLQMSATLEPTVYEIELRKWKINILWSQHPPPQVFIPKTPRSKPKTKSVSNAYVDGVVGHDIWSEDDSDSFIVDEDDVDFYNDQHQDPAALYDDGLNNAMDIDEPVAFNTTDAGESDIYSGPMFDLTGVASSGTPVKLPAERKAENDEESKIQKLPLSEIEAIASMGTQYWESIMDYERLIITLVFNWPSQRREEFFGPIQASENDDELWDSWMVQALQEIRETKPGHVFKFKRKPMLCLAWLFAIYTGFAGAVTNPLYKPRGQQSAMQLDVEYIEQMRGEFSRFYGFVKSVGSSYHAVLLNGDKASASEDPSTSEDVGDMDVSTMTHHQQKKWEQRKKEATVRRLQLEVKKNTQAMEARRLKLRQELEDSAELSKEKSRLIINETKETGKGLIFVHDHIAPRIKDHQVDGVRFMWSIITNKTKNASGCLLAHTMGLGKTMQAITLMAAIAQASKSNDAAISSQIPEHLKVPNYLVVCPASLICNWREELQEWAPNKIIGPSFVIEAADALETRMATAEAWAIEGGVLLVGYSLIRQNEQAHITKLLQDKASLIIADEAHYFKNPDSLTAKAMNSFKTNSRVALTGSPLANNVLEYFAMLNWVAPGFLGDRQIFEKNYGNTISDGLKSADSDYQMQAKVCLEALKILTAPKVQRKTMKMMEDTLMPPKKEFVIHLKLSAFQQKIYKTSMELKRGYLEVKAVNNKGFHANITNLWAMTATVRLLLTHPAIYRADNDKKLARASIPLEPLYQRDFAQIDDPLELKYSPKMLVVDKIIEESFACNDKVLIFSQSLEALNFIQEHICKAKKRPYRRIDGAVNTNARQKVVNEFNEGRRAEVFLISTTAGGVGLNMHGANRVIVFDFNYNPVNEQQCIGRAWRLGQVKPVFVYWLIYSGTYEHTIYNMQTFKRQLAARVVDDQHPLIQPHLDYRLWFKDYVVPEMKDTSAVRGEDSVLDAILDSDCALTIPSINHDNCEEEEEADKVLPAQAQAQAENMVARHLDYSNKGTAMLELGLGPAEQPSIQANQPEDAAQAHEVEYPAANPLDSHPEVAMFPHVASLPHRQNRHPQPSSTEVTYQAQKQYDMPVVTDTAQVPHGLLQGSDQAPHASQQLSIWQVQQQLQHTQPTPKQAPVVYPYHAVVQRPNAASMPCNIQQRPTPDQIPGDQASFTLHQVLESMASGALTQPGTSNKQTMIDSAVREPQLSEPLQAPRPMTIRNAEQRFAGSSQPYERQVREQMMDEFQRSIPLPEYDTLMKVLAALEPHMVKMGGIEKSHMWTRVRDLVHSNHATIQAMQQITPEHLLRLLSKTKKDVLELVVLQVAASLAQHRKSSMQDPDHAGQFLQRLKKESKDSVSNERISADAAAIHDIIRKRRSRSSKASSTPQQPPTASNKPGSSATAPWVIED
ncbi:hypothetical protein BD289DRAFT_449260 [Coniella lustricola]|uniref:P-loop containing nucleoside triphosphate hydrolase protein n=1 Tax=Coniella lustricola TaxID=2025994 RepID=A0A2T3AN02_9PEZI|nr:hypothetical protein BD289DRAFT_449260 [Coniella lustricola]